MPGAPVSLVRAAWLLVRLRARRLRNRLLARRSWRRGPDQGAAPTARTGTPAKRRSSWLFALLFGVYFPFLAFQQARAVLSALSHREVGVELWSSGDALPPAAIHDLSIEMAILTLVGLVMALANKELSAPEWDLEWLATLPIPGSALLAIRVVERALLNPPALMVLGAFTTAIAWSTGFGAATPLVAAATSLSLLLIVAAFWTVIDTALRLRLTAPKLRNVQALLSIGSLATLIAALAPATGMLGPIDQVTRYLPVLATSGPAALAVRALTRSHGRDTLAPLGQLGLEALLIAALAVLTLTRLLRAGVVSGGARESGRQDRRVGSRVPGTAPRFTAGEATQEVAAREAAGAPRRAWLTPLQRRDLRLLARDRNFLVQTLLLPILIVATQFFFRTRAGHAALPAASNPAHVAAAAFGISAYAIMFSAFQALNTEGQALWILYTVPYRLERLLRQKATLWASVSLVYPAVLLALSYTHGGLTWRAVALSGIALVGVPIYATIATALSVFASDPLAPTTQRRLRIGYTYLYMGLAGLYTYALYATGIWQKGVLMVLTGLMALALWQKACDELPFLLDPTASPGARVSVADGMIAAVLFFVTQGVVGIIALTPGEPIGGRVLTEAFVWAGAVTFAIMRFTFWRTHATGVPRLLGPGVARAIGVGIGGAALAALAAAAYLLALRRFGRLPAAEPEALAAVRAWLVPLAIVAAPIFEEFIFRGLIFGGLRRSYGGWRSALASAGIFAMVHPPLSVAPVFVMGLVAALVYDRAGMLLAPMVVHAGYNAAITWLQPLLTR